MVRFFFLLFISAGAVFPGAASAVENIRVAVADNQRTVTVSAPSGVLEGGGHEGARKRVIKPVEVGSRPIRFTSSGVFLEVNGKSYRGSIEIRKKTNGLLLVINDLNVEDYLKGVVAAEIPHDWQPEALKAQAVASRTYALYQKKTAGSRPYHILATVDSQVYGGKSDESPAAARAVRETDGVVVTYKGDIIPAFYHSSCGGQTESALELWGIDAPYLRGVDCECQRISRYGVWEKTISITQMVDSLRKLGYRLTSILSVGIDGITPAGRVKRVAIRDAEGMIFVPAEKIRAALGYNQVPSVFFEIELSGSEIVISGRGMGHGVGLCQWGAEEMAERGFDYKAILAHYYPGTQLVKKETR